jgi:ABC-type nitrate/sulfonate/bicarbonate transport system permease component
MSIPSVDLDAAAVPTRRRGSRPDARSFGGALGVVVLLVVWWLLAVTVLSKGSAVPTPWAVVRQVLHDGWTFYGPNVRATAGEAAKGFLWGNVAAIGLAVVVLLVPPVEALALQLGLMSYCMPIIAVGPILVVVFNGRTPMVALSALSVFFTTLIGSLVGLRAADPVTLDVVKAYGGGRWQQLRRVQVISAVPGVLAALKIAAPAALLGAIIGEFLGNVDSGIGVSMTIAEQQLDVARTWGIALVAAVVAGVAYGAIALIARLLTPWVNGRSGAPR